MNLVKDFTIELYSKYRISAKILQGCFRDDNRGYPQHCVWALKVIYNPLYSMNNFVTNKSKLPQVGAQVFPYMG